MDEISRLRELLRGMTPGPWRVRDGGHRKARGNVVDMDGGYVAQCATDADGVGCKDAALIVEAVNALPRLLSELEALRKVAEAAVAVAPIGCFDPRENQPDPAAGWRCGECVGCAYDAALTRWRSLRDRGGEGEG